MIKYKVLIIGAGSIGAMKPNEFDSPESKQIYTHAHACYSHPSIELVGIVDQDINKALRAASKWNTKGFMSVERYFNLLGKNDNPDIVIVAVNTEYHHDIIFELVKYKPKVIICEKPFCSNIEQALFINEICRREGINLIINYNRGFVPELKQLSSTLKNGGYGDIYNFTLRYSRGLLREASHAFHWCLQTFGTVSNKQEHKRIFDSPVKDDYSSFITFNTPLCYSVAFIPIDGSYSTYNADIYTEKGRIELLNNWKTIRFHHLHKSTYGDYKATGLLFEDKQTQLDQSLTFLLDYAIENINSSGNNKHVLAVHKHLRLS